MKIEPFRIRVTKEQSIIVQKIILGNGHTWNGGDTQIKYQNITYLVFKFDLHYKNYNEMVLLWSDREESDVNITFNEFMGMYSIQGQRREKLEILKIILLSLNMKNQNILKII